MDDHHFITKMQKKKEKEKIQCITFHKDWQATFSTKCMTFPQGHHKIIITESETSGIDHSKTM
jgi:hypothetical protein